MIDECPILFKALILSALVWLLTLAIKLDQPREQTMVRRLGFEYDSYLGDLIDQR